MSVIMVVIRHEVEAEREACIAILEDMRPKNDRLDWTEYASDKDRILNSAIEAINARYSA